MLSVFLTVGEKKNGGTFLRPSPYIGDKNVLRHFNALCQVFFGHVFTHIFEQFFGLAAAAPATCIARTATRRIDALVFIIVY